MIDLSLLVAAAVSDPASMKMWAYIGFIALVMVFLALDLGVFHREAHEVSMKESVIWSCIWLTCGVSITAFIYGAYQHHWLGLGLETPTYVDGAIVLAEATGATAAIQYLTGYVVEKSLAMDNIFVIAMIFGYFAIPAKYQHRVLFWGIIGALIMRGGMIFLGAELIMRYTWILIVFGLFLILTAAKMALIQSYSDPGKNPIVKIAKRFFRTVDFYDGQKIFHSPHCGTDIPQGFDYWQRDACSRRSEHTLRTPGNHTVVSRSDHGGDYRFGVAVDSIPAISRSLLNPLSYLRVTSLPFSAFEQYTLASQRSSRNSVSSIQR